MKRTLPFLLVFCAAVFILINGAADRSIVRADNCKATATATMSPGKNNKYTISSDVTSTDCIKLQCRGFIHYLVGFHLPDGTKKQAHDLRDFRIDPGAQKNHFSYEYEPPEKGAVVDSFGVESVNCITTAP